MKALLLVAISILLLPCLLWAGQTGKIEGTITDEATGDPIAGAIVTVVGTSHGATSDFNGDYLISNVPHGNYSIKVNASGYSTVEIANLTVASDQTTEQDFRMRKADSLPDKISKAAVEPESDSKQVDMFIPREVKEQNILDQCLSVVRRPKISPPQPDASGCNIYPPAHGGTSIVNGQAYDAMFFRDYGTNPFIDTEDDHLSTFAIDVDDASYIMARSYLERGSLPPDEAVRSEEFINHFKYNYPKPEEEAFSVNIEGGPSRFGQNSKLLKIGIQGKQIDAEDRKPANLVFVIDVSGSMEREDRLELVKKALEMLVYNLEEDDEVGIVAYGSNARVILEPTSIEHADRILAAIDWLHPDGSTNAEQGLKLGYKMADRNFDRRKINRIILCSDGVANVGTTNADELLKWIKKYADRGITLSTIGFGMGNYNDILMEKLGDKGNGQYAYVDDLAEAKRVFMKNVTGMLQVIARDVKIQVDFDPAVVRSYRLLGYENRDVADEKFRDDREDGGEIGSGHQVTALYEVKLYSHIKSNHLATVYVRYKHPTYNEADEVRYDVSLLSFQRRFESCSADFKLAAAAAEFAEILGKSYWAKGSTLTEVYQLAMEVSRLIDNRDVREFVDLIGRAERFENQLADR